MATLPPSKFYKAAHSRRILESDDDSDNDDGQLSDGSDIRLTIQSDSGYTSSDEERQSMSSDDRHS